MAATTIWKGASGHHYTFEIYPVGTLFYNVSGVYIACRGLYPGSFEALYVGEAESLHNRLNAGAKNHDGLKRAARSGMTHICAMIVNGEAERLRIETDLRHGLNPSCNRQPTPGLRSVFD